MLDPRVLAEAWRELGRQLAACRRAAALNQTRLAAAISYSRSTVANVETGRQAAPHNFWVRCDHALDAGGVLVEGWQKIENLKTEGRKRLLEAELSRRQVLDAGATIAGLTVISRIGPPVTCGVDDDLLASGTTLLRRLDQTTPARTLVSSAVAHAELIAAKRHQCPRGNARQLWELESEAAGLVAWLYADLDEQDNARSWYRKAIAAAQASGQPVLACYMRGSLAQFATTVAAPAQALALVTQTRQHLPRAAAPIAELWLDTLEAAALAAQGERAALGLLENALHRAQNPINTEPVWPWLFRLDEYKILNQRAVAASRLGDHRIAEELFGLCEQVPVPPKQRAAIDVAHANALTAAGDVDRACAMAVRALSIGQPLGSERVIRAVTDPRAQLGRHACPHTAELDSMLLAAYEEQT